VSDKADLETTLTELEKSLKDSVAERDDVYAQLDAEKVGLSVENCYFPFCHFFKRIRVVLRHTPADFVVFLLLPVLVPSVKGMRIQLSTSLLSAVL